MKNILTIENGTAILLSNVDDGTNTIFINGEEIPASSWVGSGVYQYIESGVTFTIQKTNANTGNIMLQLVQGTAYRLVKQFEGEPYNSGDPLDTDLANDDYMPFYDASDGTRKNSLWSNIVAKIKAALGIASSGTTFLRKDGTWATPTNTTYTFATGDSNGQIKVTPSGGSAQNVSVKGLGTAAYTASSDYAVSKTLTNENLNNVTTPGFYNAGGGNTCTNTGIDSGTAFGLEVVHTAAGSYYWQIINPCGTSNFYRRVCSNGTWGAWTKDNYTNTWRGIQNNLTSDSTTDSLSAAQGKVLKGLVDGKASSSHTHTTSIAADSGTSQLTMAASTKYKLTAGGTSFVFTSTPNTWRGIQNNLTSDSTTDSLSAAQGKALNAKFTNGSVTKVGTATLGDSNTPIYLDAGTPKKCSDFVAVTGGSFRRADGETTIVYIGSDTSGYKGQGRLRIYCAPASGTTYYYANLLGTGDGFTADRNFYFPNASGTFALVAQLRAAGTGLSLSGNTLSVKYGTAAGTACQGNDSRLSNYVPKSGGTFSGNIGVYNGGNNSRLQLGNQSEMANGVLRIVGNNNESYGQIYDKDGIVSANRTYYMPNSTGTIQVSSSSSRRVKKNIRDMTEDEAKKLLEINIVKFDYKGEWCGGEKNQSGVIAEDTLDILPEVVNVPKSYDPNAPVDEEYNTPPDVDYRKFIPYLIKMVQVQQAEIDELKAEIKALKEG